MASAADLAIIISARDQAGPAFAAVRGHLTGLHAAAQQAAGGLQGLAGAAGAPLRALGGLTDTLGRIGLASIGVQALGAAAVGAGHAIGVGLNSELEETRAQMVAFTKDAAATDQILVFLREEANKTPFTFRELSQAIGTLIPAARQAGVPLMELNRTAQILAASNPAQGLEGAAFALREAVSGDFTSVIERFNLSRVSINRLKDEGVPALEIVKRSLQEIGIDYEIVSKRSETLAGRWSTFTDTIDTLRIKLSEPIFDAVKNGLLGLQQFFERNQEAIDAFVSMAASGLRQLIADVGQFGSQVFDALSRGDVKGAFDIVLQAVTDLGHRMFGAGFDLVMNLAGGMLHGLTAAIDAAASVALKIAEFFIGASPPPQGPLSKIEEGGRALIESYAAAIGKTSLGPVEEVAQRVQDTLTNFKGLETLGKDVEGEIRLIDRAIQDTQAEVKGWQRNISDIKDAYEAQLEPLQRQLDLIHDTTDATRDLQGLNDQITDLELKKAALAAEGDPVRRAQLQNQLDLLRGKQEEVRWTTEETRLRDQLKDKKLSDEQKEQIRLQLQEIALQRQMAGMVDHEALARIREQQAELKTRQDVNQIEQAQLKAQQDMAALPLQQQIKAIKREQQEVLKPMEEQVRLHQRDLQALQDERGQWQALKQDISAAVQEVKPKAGGAKGAAGAAAGALDLKKMLEGMHVEETVSIAGANLAQKLTLRVQTWLTENAGALIGFSLGQVLGGLAFGPLGAIVGAALGSSIGKKLTERFPDLGERLQKGLEELDEVFQKKIFPALGEFADWLGTVLPPVINWITETAWPALVTGAGLLGTFLTETLFPRLGELRDWLGTVLPPVINWITETAWPAMQEGARLVSEKLGELINWFKDLVDQLEKRGVFTDLQTAWDELRKAGDILRKMVQEELTPIFESFRSKAEEVWKMLNTNLTPEAKNSHTALSLLSDFVKLVLVAQLAALVTLIKDLALAFKSVVEWVSNTKDTLRDMEKFLTGDWSERVEAAVRLLERLRRLAGQSIPAPDTSGGHREREERQFGGPVFPGRAYLVGERGPELFMPGRTGTIVPNGGGTIGPIAITINGAGSPADTARAVRDELIKLARRNGQTVFAGVA